MSAPFALPDLMEIRTYPGYTLLESDVPCRQVPQFMKPNFAFSAGTDRPVYSITHRVDFDYTESVLDNSVQAQDSEYHLDATRVLIITYGGVTLELLVAWVEDRYTNTPEYYCRAYCWRLNRTLP